MGQIIIIVIKIINKVIVCRVRQYCFCEGEGPKQHKKDWLVGWIPFLKVLLFCSAATAKPLNQWWHRGSEGNIRQTQPRSKSALLETVPPSKWAFRLMHYGKERGLVPKPVPQRRWQGVAWCVCVGEGWGAGPAWDKHMAYSILQSLVGDWAMSDMMRSSI